MPNPTQYVEPSTVAIYTDAIVRALDTAGADTSQIMQLARVDRVRSNDPLLRISDLHINAVFSRAVEATSDPYFGLKVARYIVPGTLHALGYALLASETLEEFCQRLVRFQGMVSTSAECAISVADTELEFSARATNPALCFESHDAWVGMVLRMMRNASHDALTPLRLDLIRPLPAAGDGPFRDFFGCPVRFGCARIGFYFDLAAMRAPLPGANRELAQHHDHIVRGYLEKLDRGDIVNRVRTAIVRGLGGDQFSRGDIAREQNVSASTLQAKLAQRGTSFQALLDDTRHELALGYMGQSHLSITEIAFMLGFSDLSNFIRAFKRWTGKSPTEFRASSSG